MTQRIQWIDAMKGFGMIAVVLGHIGRNELVINYLYSFHIPLFFFISGYTFNPDKYTHYKLFINKRIKTLLFPYLCFSVISYPIWILQCLLGDKTGFSVPIYQPFIGTLYGNGIQGGLVHNPALWFLPCLYCTEVLFYFLHRLSRNIVPLGLFLFISSIIGYLDSLFMPFRLPWGMDIAFTAVVFYGFGFITKKIRPHAFTSSTHKVFMLVLVLLICNIFANYLNVNFLDGRVDMNWNRYGNYFYFYLSAFSGVFFYMFISKKLTKLKFLSYLGRNSIIIFALHFATNTLAVKTILFLTPLTKKYLVYSFDGNIFCTILSLTYIIPIIYLFDGHFPVIIKRKII